MTDEWMEGGMMAQNPAITDRSVGVYVNVSVSERLADTTTDTFACMATGLANHIFFFASLQGVEPPRDPIPDAAAVDFVEWS